jgi:DNA-binding CsgD family transcriptional regulator
VGEALETFVAAGETYDDRRVREHPSPTDREYYEYMDSIGCGLPRTVLGERSAELRMGLTFYGPIRDGDHETEHRFLRGLAPHMGRAAHLTLRTADASDKASFGEQLFEMSSAMLLLNGQGRVQRMNSRAEAVLALNDGLVLAQQHLRAASSSVDARLQREIGAALDPRRAALTDGFALVSRPSRQPVWAVSAVRLPASQRLGLPPRPQVLVTIVGTVPCVSPARLRQGFDLSQAEAEIAAALAGGMTLDQIAAGRRASLETVRGQLKSIFAKLEVSTQAQLVGRIAAAAEVVRAPSKG